MQRARLPYLLIVIAATVAILPLLLNGCSCGHDFDFHLLNWLEAASQFTHGTLHPHWAYTPAWNAGEPRFVFYPPISWTIGAILGLVFPQSWGWQWTPILYTWLALTAAGLSLYHLAREFTPPPAATLAAILYTTNPYTLFTAYERTAYAELLAAAFIPLLLHAILRGDDKGGVTIPRIAIPIALLWLTNAPAAVMSCYALALLTIIRLTTNPGAPSFALFAKGGVSRASATAPAHSNPTITPSQTTNPGAPYLDSEMWDNRAEARSVLHSQTHKSPGAPSFATRRVGKNTLRLTVNAAAGTALGLGLAAFYILPAAYERRYVQIAMAIIPNMRIQDNFLFHHTGDLDHDHVLHTASLIAIILITLTVATLIILIRRNGFNSATNPGAPSSRRFLPLRWASRESGSPSSAFARWGEESATAPAHLNRRQLLYSLTTVTITITLLLTPLTSFLWTHAPELPFLQFPWRLLAILAAVLALAIALVLTPLQLKPTQTTILTILIAAALTYPAYATFHQPCDEEDTIQSRVALFHSNQGTDPTDEYTPITADNDSLAHTNPPYWLSTDPNAKAPVSTQPGPAPTHLTLNATTPETLILNLRDYPAWRITLNGTPITTRIQRDDGLIALTIPAGPSTVTITYTQTLDQTIGDILSLLSVAILALLILAPAERK